MSVVIPEGDEDHLPLFPEKERVLSYYLVGLTRVGHRRYARRLGVPRRRWDLTPAGVAAADVDSITGALLEADGDHRRMYFRCVRAFERMRRRLDPGRRDLDPDLQAEGMYRYTALATAADIYGWSILV